MTMITIIIGGGGGVDIPNDHGQAGVLYAVPSAVRRSMNGVIIMLMTTMTGPAESKLLRLYGWVAGAAAAAGRPPQYV